MTCAFSVFKDKPKNPPSMGQAVKVQETNGETFAQSFKKMAKNRAFILLLFWYSICGALLRILGAVLGELVSINFVVNYLLSTVYKSTRIMGTRIG